MNDDPLEGDGRRWKRRWGRNVIQRDCMIPLNRDRNGATLGWDQLQNDCLRDTPQFAP